MDFIPTTIHSSTSPSEDSPPSGTATRTIKYAQGHSNTHHPLNGKPEISFASIQNSPVKDPKRVSLPSTTMIPDHELESEVPGNPGIAMRWLLASLAFVILSPAVSVILGLTLHGRDFQYFEESTYDGRTVTPSPA